MARQGKTRQGKASTPAWRRRKRTRVTDVSDFKSRRLGLSALLRVPTESFTGTIDYVERGQHFNKWRKQSEERLEVFFVDGHSVVLNDGMEQTIIEDYGTDAGSWTGRQLTVFVEHTKHENRKTGEIKTISARALRCYPEAHHQVVAADDEVLIEVRHDGD